MEKFRIMVKAIFIILFIFLINSCSSQNQNINDELTMNWVVSNKLLREQILFYIDSVNTPDIEDKFPLISLKFMGDTSIYTIGYCINIFTLTYCTPHLAFDINGNFVCLSIENSYDFSLSNESLIGIMKIHFPDQYEYYKKYGDYPPAITAREILWVLTFKGDQLIKKEVIRN